MNVIVFGSTGLVGHGTLLECLEDPEIRRVVSVVRRPTGITHPKLTELVHGDFTDFTPLEPQLGDLDACFFCLGTSSAGMKEADYRRVTYDITLAAARTLKRLNPNMAFCYVSGTGTDSTEKGSMMWARVKGQVENELMAMFSSAYMFRPGYIHPVKGVTSASGWQRKIYAATRPLGALLTKFPKIAVRTDVLGRAMIAAVRHGAPKFLYSTDINRLGAESRA